MTQARERAIDELLVLRCQAGDRASFDLLLRRWQRPLWRYARRLAGSDDVAWDVTQETWMTVLRNIRRLRDPAWFVAWVHRIVRNKCADHWRRAGRRQHLAETLTARPAPGGEAPADTSSRAVAQAMGRLPPDDQELLTLRYGGELNIVEMAVVLGLPAGTVKSRLHHARAQLRVLLEGAES